MTNFDVIRVETDQEVSDLASLFILQFHFGGQKFGAKKGVKNLKAQSFGDFGVTAGVRFLQDQFTTSGN